MQDSHNALNAISPSGNSLRNSRGKKKYFNYQVMAFFFTFCLYMLSHAARTVWGVTKKGLLRESGDYYTDSKLGILDFIFMLAYASGQFINGTLGDRVNIKVMLFLGMSSCIVGLSLFGYLEGVLQTKSLFVDAITFIFNGFGQSTV